MTTDRRKHPRARGAPRRADTDADAVGEAPAPAPNTDYGRATTPQRMKERTATPVRPVPTKPRNEPVKEREFGFTKSFDSFEEANAWDREHRIRLALQRTPDEGFHRTADLSNACRQLSPLPERIFTASFDGFDEYERWRREQRERGYR